MNEERLDELYDQALGNDRREATVTTMKPKEALELIAAARECNELEAENAALKDVNWDISYPDGESLATLKAERDALKVMIDAKFTEANQVDTLRADNAALREAIAFAHAEGFEWPSDPLPPNRTPADSLREYRNGVLEEAAKKADKYYPTDDEIKEQGGCTQGQSMVRSVASAIRAMKEAYK